MKKSIFCVTKVGQEVLFGMDGERCEPVDQILEIERSRERETIIKNKIIGLRLRFRSFRMSPATKVLFMGG